MHVPRTGGTAFGRVLSNRFAAGDSIAIYYGDPPSEDQLSRYRYISGHVSMSFPARLRRRPYIVTVLRDPIERALSVYWLYRRFRPRDDSTIQLWDQDPGAYDRRRETIRLARQCSLGELIDRAPQLAREHLGDRQTRMLAGSKPLGRASLQQATAGLDRCDFVGLTNCLVESATWLARRLGWAELGPLPHEGVYPGGPTAHDVPSETLDKLHRLTALDSKLYRQGERSYRQQIREWKQAADPRDPSVAVPDAQPARDLPFDRPIPGGGWNGRERIGNGSSFCWIGSTRRAWVDLEPGPGDRRLLIEIAHVLKGSILEAVRINVDGVRLDHSFATDEAGVLTASAELGQRHLNGDTVRVEIEIPRTARPSEVNPESTDGRELSMAVQRVALVPA